MLATLNIRETRQNLSQAVDQAAAGEEIQITRHGKPVARLIPEPQARPTFPDHSALRASLPPMRQSAAEFVRQMRDEERY